MHEAAIEFVVPTDVIDVSVRCHGSYELLKKAFGETFEALYSYAGVNEQISVSSGNVPDIAPQERNDVRLEYKLYAVIQGLHFEPMLGNRQRCHLFPFAERRLC
jgi:hypothetical protein